MNRLPMQKLSRLFVILPCHSLEDFPTHHQGDQATNLLANWTSLWHPALISACSRKPDWHRADESEFRFELEQDECALVVVPSVAENSFDRELIGKFESHQSIVVRENSDRSSIVEVAANQIPAVKLANEKVDPEIAQDFHALGYAFLQTQIMTRQLRYSSNLDEARFEEVTLAAAAAATDGDSQKAKELLMRCFDLLLEEKNGYYPVEPELIDVVLTAPTTLGKSFERQLEETHTQNILMSGQDANRLVKKHPEIAARLKSLVQEETITLVGGMYSEIPTSLLSSESLLNQIRLGQSTIQSHFGAQPNVFMRRTYGLTPTTPGVLDQLDFVGAVHATLDDGMFPKSSGCNIRWTGDDERSLLAFGEVPLNADDSGAFLGLGVAIGEAIDSAHVASVMFAHWPSKVCQSFEDLKRIAGYGPLFGGFVGFESYFEQVYDPGYGDTFVADEYRTPYLKQAIEKQTPNPVSRFTKYWERFYALSSLRSLLVQACSRSSLESNTIQNFQDRLATLQTDVEVAVNATEIDVSIDQRLLELKDEMERSWSGGDDSKSNAKAKSDAVPDSRTLINTTSFKRRIEIQSGSGSAVAVKNQIPIVLADQNSNGSQWVLELPPMGVVEFSPKLISDANAGSDVFRKDPPTSEGRILRNEFFELEVDESTGGIRAIMTYGKRVNLCGQKVAMRIPGEKDSRKQPLTKARYTQMVATDIQSVSDSRLSGQIVSKGHLLDGETIVSGFVQTVRVVRGMRVAELTVELDPKIELSQSRNHYICSRFAWKDETSRLIANSNESKNEIAAEWIEATNFIELNQGDHRLTVFTGGLPYHRRSSRRMLDSLLVVGHEQARKFKIGLGVDVPYPMRSAIGRLTPAIQMNHGATSNRAATSNWTFHFNCKNIVATHWEPLIGGENGQRESSWTGVMIRLRETEGRSGKLTLSCPQQIESAMRTNFNGDFLQSIEVSPEESAKVEIDFSRFEYFQIKLHWKT